MLRASPTVGFMPHMSKMIYSTFYVKFLMKLLELIKVGKTRTVCPLHYMPQMSNEKTIKYVFHQKKIVQKEEND